MNDKERLQEIKETIEKARGNWEWTYRIAWHCIGIVEQQRQEIERYKKVLKEINENKCCGFHWQHKEIAKQALEGSE